MRRWIAASALATCLLASLPGRTCQAADPPQPEKAREKETVLSLTFKGGWLMIPIGLCSMIVLTFGIERTISLRRSRIGNIEILDRLEEDIPSLSHLTPENQAAAIAHCDESGTVLGAVLRPGIEKLHRDEPHVQTFLEEGAAKEVHLLKRKLRPFSVCASLAPLLGLLGTIFGMISCFENASAADAASRAESLARGIYEALVTTAAGLCVAIPAMALFYYFNGRVDRAADLIDETATRFLDHFFGVEHVAAAAPGAEPARREGQKTRRGRESAAESKAGAAKGE